MNIVIEEWMLWCALLLYAAVNYVQFRTNLILLIKDIGNLL